MITFSQQQNIQQHLSPHYALKWVSGVVFKFEVMRGQWTVVSFRSDSLGENNLDTRREISNLQATMNYFVYYIYDTNYEVLSKQDCPKSLRILCEGCTNLSDHIPK